MLDKYKKYIIIYIKGVQKYVNSIIINGFKRKTRKMMIMSKYLRLNRKERLGLA